MRARHSADADPDWVRFWRTFAIVAPVLVAFVVAICAGSSLGVFDTQYAAARGIADDMERSGAAKTLLTGFEDGGTPDGMMVSCRQLDGSYAKLELDSEGRCVKAVYGCFAPSGPDSVAGGHRIDLDAVNAALRSVSRICTSAGGAASAAGEGYTWVTRKSAAKAKVFGPYSYAKAQTAKDADGEMWRVAVTFSNSGSRTLVEAVVCPAGTF